MTGRLSARYGTAAGIVLLLAAWSAAASTGASAQILPTPWGTAAAVGRDLTTFFLPTLGETLGRAALGYLWGNLAGLAVAAVVLALPRLENVTTQLGVISQCVPVTAIGPIVLLVFGGRVAAVFLSALLVFFTTMVGAVLGMRQAPGGALDLVRAYGGGRLAAIRKVQLVAGIPATLTAFRVAVPAAVLGAVVGEYLGGTENGVGVALIAAQREQMTERVWGLSLLIGLAALAGYGLVGLLARVATPWAADAAAPARPDADRRPVPRLVVDRIAMTVLAALVAVLLWAAVLRAFDVNELIGRSPAKVWAYLVTDPDAAEARAELLGYLGATARDCTVGYLVGLATAAVLGALFSLSRTAEDVLTPTVMLLRMIPIVVVTPLVTLVFGVGVGGVTAIVTLTVVLPALANVLFGLRAAQERHGDLVRAFGGGRAQLLAKVALPGAVPALMASARISVPAAVTGAMIGEWLATGEGVGGFISRSAGGFGYDAVYASAAVLAALTMAVYTAVGVLDTLAERRFGAAA